MKKIITLIVCSMAAVVYGAPIQFISHAGDQYSAPAHSIASYKAALALNADFLKLDLQLTKDDVIVMHHDRTTKRKMDNAFAIASNTYKDLYEKCTYKKIKGYDKEKIVRLEQVLELIKDSKVSLWLDFKGYSPKRPKKSALLVEKTMAMLRNAGIPNERLMVATWSQPALQYMKKHYPDVRRVLHINVLKRPNDVCILTCKGKVKLEDVIPEIVAKGKELDLHGFNMPIISKYYQKEWVKQLQDNGYWVSLWFVQKEKGSKMAVEAGANAVVTDNLKEVYPGVKNAEKAAATEK